MVAEVQATIQPGDCFATVRSFQHVTLSYYLRTLPECLLPEASAAAADVAPRSSTIFLLAALATAQEREAAVAALGSVRPLTSSLELPGGDVYIFGPATGAASD